MIAAVLCLMLGELTFSGQEIPGLRIDDVDPLTGHAACNLRRADLDGDGLTDLVGARRILLQRNGRFPQKSSAAIPDCDERPFADVWEGALYLRFRARLDVLRRNNGVWQAELSHPMAWRPAWGEPAPGPACLSGEGGLRFERFLHDIDGDGTPEIVVAGSEGLHVYVRGGAAYAHAAVLDVFPPLMIAPAKPPVLWPPDQRRLTLPAREMACQFSVEGPRVRIVTAEPPAPRQVRYRVAHYRIVPEDGFGLSPESPAPFVSPLLPAHMRPCRLSRGGGIEFAGGDWRISHASALPTPVFETVVTRGQGHTQQAFRVRSFRPHCMLADFDRDGDRDVIVEQTALFDGGVRETISRFLTARELEHTVRIHLRDANGVYAERPDVVGRFRIRLNKAPRYEDRQFRRYVAAELVNCTGDFDGDGFGDAAVQIEPRLVGVFLGSIRGFPSSADRLLSVPADSRFDVADVDGDGRSDLVASWREERGEGGWEPRNIVHFSRGGEAR